MSKNNKNKLVPRLRFPTFKDKGEWDFMQIGNILNAESSNLALNKLELKQSGYAVYGADSVVGFIDNYQHKDPYISIVKDGSGVGRLNLCDKETSTLGTLSVLKSKDENKYKLVWAFYLLNTIDFTSYVKGSGIPHIYFSDYKNENISAPKHEEQQKIAACLSSLDEVIIAESQKLEVLKDHKKGLLQNLFPQEGDTVPKFRFKEFEDSGEWVEKSIQQLLDEGIITSHLDGNHGSLYPRADEFSREGVPYITANDFIAGVVDFSKCKRLPISKAKQFKKGVAKSGDILFAHNATVGPVAKLITNLPFVVLSTTATYFRCDNVKLINDYMKYALTSTLFVKQYTKVMSQSTRNQVPITTQRKFFIYIPNCRFWNMLTHHSVSC